ncbi:hypothetical protein N8698_03295 [Candidatus Pelagibacter sp.]|nr:hypothetical protein [Candidatus Pelagibacter sp.]
MSALLYLPESYEFECSDETRLRTFRYPDKSMIEFSNVDYKAQNNDENTIELHGKKIVIAIGVIDPSKKKNIKHWGTLFNYDADVSIHIAYEDKQYQELINSLENNQSIEGIAIGFDINRKEAKKKTTEDPTNYLIDNFKIVQRIK